MAEQDCRGTRPQLIVRHAAQPHLIRERHLPSPNIQVSPQWLLATQLPLLVPLRCLFRYLKAPPGVKLPFGMCFKVLKFIYGLKQASRLFHELLTTYFLTMGFTRCDSYCCLFYIVYHDDIAIICLYVDDRRILLATLRQTSPEI